VATDLFDIRSYQIELIYPHDKFKLVSYNLTQPNKTLINKAPINATYSELLSTTPNFTVSDIDGVIRILCVSEVTQNSFDLLQSNANGMFELVFEPIQQSIDPMNEFSLFGMRTTFVDDNFTEFHYVNLEIPTLINGVTAIENNPNFDNLIVYPNPASDYVNIEFDLHKNSKIEIAMYNLLGQKISHETNIELPIGRNTIKYSVSSLPVGVYNLHIENLNNKSERQVVKVLIKK
jgi:hypothetical protein